MSTRVTTKQFAEAANRTQQTVRLWNRKGLISPCAKINGRWLYLKEDVEKFLSNLKKD